MLTVTLARNAMATRFEIVLHGEDAARLRAAGEEALDEIERLESQLSLYRPSSEIARLNAGGFAHPLKLSPAVFRLLQQAQTLSRETAGAFDITVAPLVRCWGFMGGGGRKPSPAELDAARAQVGLEHLRLDESDFTAGFDVAGAMLDLGAIGKGYAIDCAVEILREAGVTSALVHGGSSTVYGLGQPPGGAAWQIAIQNPPGVDLGAVVGLRDSALSVSAGWGKSFTLDGKTYGHVFDPRLGRPVEGCLVAAVGLPSATETDAFSTALLVDGLARHDQIASLRPGMATLAVSPGHEVKSRLIL
ncbi:MAG TPA: FAD:protein FMN transferase [Verrucomicrobiae bacterium]|jgi:thiamine biosynthesis lipoprotein|nr:FAD:protein FMN transferase [Verrucomicrobiae bacterium]